MYTCFDGENQVLLGLFVDDMFVIGKLLARIGSVKSFLHSRFRMKDLGAATFLLGMEIRRLPSGDIRLVQEKYLNEVLANFPVDNSRAAIAPLPPACKLSQDDAPRDEAAKTLTVPKCDWVPDVLGGVYETRHCRCHQQLEQV